MNENSIGSVIPVKNETSADPANSEATLAFCFCPSALNQIAAAIAGSPNIIVRKNPDWNVPALLMCVTAFAPVPSIQEAGTCPKILISPATPCCVPPTSVNQTGALITWCNPNGISNLLMIPYPPMIPALPHWFPLASPIPLPM